MNHIKSLWHHPNSIKIEWNLGKRCNYDCSYCPSLIHDLHSSHTDISILKATIDTLTTIPKNLRISLTGGEPTVHPKIDELLEYMQNSDVSWVNMTTNGTRPSKWYIENQQYFSHCIFSLHFEFEWQRVVNTIIDFKKNTTKDFFVNIMAHHMHMQSVKTVTDIFNSNDIKYTLRRIRWTESDHDTFNDSKYTDHDLEWLINNDSTAKPNVLYNDRKMHTNDVIKLHLNKFKDWTCAAGLESLMINWDGEVHRATCRVGGSLGNIYKNTFIVPTDNVICTRNWCTCAPDISITKYDTLEQV